MTSFLKNPHAELRKKVNKLLFKRDLNQTLDAKFKHKTFAERFAMANTAFTGMSAVAQFASLVTAFTMLSYLFIGIPMLVRVVCSAALVLMIEAVKRDSINDVMKGIFQYKEVERFPALLGIITIVSSLYISVEGSKLMPPLFIADAIEIAPELDNPDDIKKDYNQRIKDQENERNNYRKSRLWKGRLARKDSKVIEQYNETIKGLEKEKADALKELNQKNESAKEIAKSDYETAKEKVSIERAELCDILVIAALGFELLFLISMYFSWWYHTECEKERIKGQSTAKVTPETPTNKEVETLEVNADTPKVTPQTLAVQGEVRTKQPIGFKHYDFTSKVNAKTPTDTTIETLEVQETTAKVTLQALEVTAVEKEYTRICLECKAPFVHNTHNHRYCKRSCMLAARAKRKAK